jgi:energy-coupling factor transporter ATP-binding protein EcfA2
MTEISIKNFQNVADAKFSIDGFTVIVGKNNIGKSAIVRSINAALTNQTGDDFIRHGEKSTEVSIVRKDIDIRWKKGDSASYVINKDEKHPYTKLNRAVPKPILDAGFRNIEVDDDLKINPLYASQFEPVFLLNKPGPQVTEILSEVYDINVISRADDLCQKENRATKA